MPGFVLRKGTHTYVVSKCDSFFLEVADLVIVVAVHSEVHAKSFTSFRWF